MTIETTRDGSIWCRGREERPVTVRYAIRWDLGGWFVEYVCRGQVITDSMKITHPDLPGRKDAIGAVERVARRYARELGVQS